MKLFSKKSQSDVLDYAKHRFRSDEHFRLEVKIKVSKSYFCFLLILYFLAVIAIAISQISFQMKSFLWVFVLYAGYYNCWLIGLNKNKECILGGDDKVAVAAIIEVLNVIKERNIPTGDIYIIFTIFEEEVYARGIGLISRKFCDIETQPGKYKDGIEYTKTIISSNW